MGDLDDQIEVVLAGLPDKVVHHRSTGASDDRLAGANFLKEGPNKVAEQFFAIADEDVIRLHVTPSVGDSSILA